MHFGRHDALFNYTLDSKLLVIVSEERDLSVILSNDLKVSQQCVQAVYGRFAPSHDVSPTGRFAPDCGRFAPRQWTVRVRPRL